MNSHARRTGLGIAAERRRTMTVDFTVERTGSKRAQILKAAAETFVDEGFEAASMDAITRAAGVSKATVYAHFGGKEELFGAIVETYCREGFESFADPDVGRAGIVEALRQIADNVIDRVFAPGALAFHRMVMSEARR